MQHWAGGFPETFEIILDLTSGAVLPYQYNTVSSPHFTTVGLEDSVGACRPLFSYRNSANLAAGRAHRALHARNRYGPSTGDAIALSITIASGPVPVNTNETITYNIHWNNIGFGAAPGATLTATIPPNTTFVRGRRRHHAGGRPADLEPRVIYDPSPRGS